MHPSCINELAILDASVSWRLALQHLRVPSPLANHGQATHNPAILAFGHLQSHLRPHCAHLVKQEIGSVSHCSSKTSANGFLLCKITENGVIFIQRYEVEP